MASRLQRRRTAGWRMPTDAVYVGPPTRWENPFAVWRNTWADSPGWFVSVVGCHWPQPSRETAVNEAVRMYREWLQETRRQTMFDAMRPELTDIVKYLRDRDLVCWCRPGAPCHADVLLEIANA